MRWILVGLIFLGGCTQQLDKELMEARRQVVNNERLYAKAELAFADVVEKEFDKMLIYQQKSLTEQTDNWIRKYTNESGALVAPPGMAEKMFAERDARAKVLADSQQVRNTAIANFRSMVVDKQRLVTLVYAEEQNAMEAKEAAITAWDSLFKTLLGSVSTAAVAVPLLVP